MLAADIQHYVSRFYLRNFGKNLYCFNKNTCKEFSASPESICGERVFYNEANTSEESFETYLSQKESIFAPIVKELIDKPDLSVLSKDKKKILAEFIAIQSLRTREDRESIRSTGEAIIRFTVDDEERKVYEKLFTEEFIRDSHTSFIQDFADNARSMILAMKWIILINRTKIPFWTSDNPIALHNELGESPLGNLGLLNSGIALRFPLSPRIILYILDPKLFGHLPSMRLINDENSVIFDNALQVRSSTRILISSDNNFELARKMINDHPEWKNPDRKRGYAYVIRDGKMVILDSS